MNDRGRHDDSPLVSVVIPAYNVEDYVADAIRSVFEQTYRNIEIICVDDGSTDGTLRVIETLAAESPFPFQIVSTPNQGPAQARQEGTDRTAGEWIQFLDSDDVLKPRKIERHLADLKQCDGEIDVHIQSYVQVDLEGRESVVRVDPDEDPMLALYFSRAGITTSVLWRRDAIERVGGWDRSLPSSEDTDLLFRIMAAGSSVRMVDEPHSIRRKRPGSVTTENPERMWRHIGRLRARMFEHLRATRSASIDDRIRLRMLRLIQRVYDFDPIEAADLQRRTLGGDYAPPLTRFRALPYVAASRIVGLHKTEDWRRRCPRLFLRP